MFVEGLMFGNMAVAFAITAVGMIQLNRKFYSIYNLRNSFRQNQH